MNKRDEDEERERELLLGCDTKKEREEREELWTHDGCLLAPVDRIGQ